MPADKLREAEVPVEGGGGFVFCVDNEGVNRGIGACRALYRIEQQGRTQGAARITPIHRKASYKSRGKDRVFRKAFTLHLGQLVQGYACGRERVVAGDDRRAQRDRDKAVGDMSANVLSCLRLQVAVQGIDAARESRALMMRCERLDRE